VVVSSNAPYPQDRPADGPQQPEYQQPQYQHPYAPAPDRRITFQPPGPTVEHPQATLAFVLGLLSVLGLLILGPFGWVVGRRVIRQIDQDPRQFSNRGLAMAGMVLGIIGTVLMLLLVALFAVGVLLFMGAAGSSR